MRTALLALTASLLFSAACSDTPPPAYQAAASCLWGQGSSGAHSCSASGKTTNLGYDSTGALVTTYVEGDGADISCAVTAEGDGFRINATLQLESPGRSVTVRGLLTPTTGTPGTAYSTTSGTAFVTDVATSLCSQPMQQIEDPCTLELFTPASGEKGPAEGRIRGRFSCPTMGSEECFNNGLTCSGTGLFLFENCDT